MFRKARRNNYLILLDVVSFLSSGSYNGGEGIMANSSIYTHKKQAG